MEQAMQQFRLRNGFDATDDDAKRALIDAVYAETSLPPPTTDEERNAILEGEEDWIQMMRIGWRPSGIGQKYTVIL